MSTQNDYIRQTIRIPPELDNALKKLASKSGRSFNAEVINRLAESIKLEQTYSSDFKTSIKEAAERISSIAQQIALTTDNNLDSALTTEERELLDWFSKANDSEKQTLISSLPQLISLLSKK